MYLVHCHCSHHIVFAIPPPPKKIKIEHLVVNEANIFLWSW